MAKISRYNGNLAAFASASVGLERTVFGDTAQADTLDANVNADYLRGWGIVATTENPKKQDFNALAYTSTQLISYLHQMGVAEYNAAQEYHTGSLCVYNGAMWQSTLDNNVGNAPGTGGWLAGLRTDDIGLTVQAYDVNTAKTNVATNFTAGLQSGGSDVLTVDSIGGGFLSIPDIGVTVQGYDEHTVKADTVTGFLDDVYVAPTAAAAQLFVDAPASTAYSARLLIGRAETPALMIDQEGGAWENTITKYAVNGITLASRVLFKIDGTINVTTGELQVAGNRVLTTVDAGTGALVYLSADQVVPDSVSTTIAWTAEDYDDSSIHVASSTTLTVPAGVTRVRLSVKVVLSGGAGSRSVAVHKNGSAVYNGVLSVDESSGVLEGVSTLLRVAGGDAFTAVVIQSTGGPVNATSGVGQSYFAMEIVV